MRLNGSGDLYHSRWLLHMFGGGAPAARREWLENNSDRARRIVRAWKRTFNWIANIGLRKSEYEKDLERASKKSIRGPDVPAQIRRQRKHEFQKTAECV